MNVFEPLQIRGTLPRSPLSQVTVVGSYATPVSDDVWTYPLRLRSISERTQPNGDFKPYQPSPLLTTHETMASLGAQARGGCRSTPRSTCPPTRRPPTWPTRSPRPPTSRAPTRSTAARWSACPTTNSLERFEQRRPRPAVHRPQVDRAGRAVPGAGRPRAADAAADGGQRDPGARARARLACAGSRPRGSGCWDWPNPSSCSSLRSRSASGSASGSRRLLTRQWLVPGPAAAPAVAELGGRRAGARRRDRGGLRRGRDGRARHPGLAALGRTPTAGVAPVVGRGPADPGGAGARRTHLEAVGLRPEGARPHRHAAAGAARRRGRAGRDPTDGVGGDVVDQAAGADEVAERLRVGARDLAAPGGHAGDPAGDRRHRGRGLRCRGLRLGRDVARQRGGDRLPGRRPPGRRRCRCARPAT